MIVVEAMTFIPETHEKVPNRYCRTVVHVKIARIMAPSGACGAKSMPITNYTSSDNVARHAAVWDRSCKNRDVSWTVPKGSG